jgi:hypothetical protein
MARRDQVLELLRPPAHRGPLIAAGAALFTVGILLEEFRLDDALPLGVHLVIVAAAAALLYALGVLAEPEGGGPPPSQSVLLVCALVVLAVALIRLADVLGADTGELSAGTLTWTSLALCAAALYPAARRNSAICAMIAGVAAGVAVLSAADWIFGLSLTGARWLLLALAIAFALASLVLRGSNPRHGELMVITGGLATFAILVLALQLALFAGFAPVGEREDVILPGFWELVVLAAGCGLVAYGAVDRVPGAAWLGVAHLAGFILVVSAGADETLLWWPLILLLLGGGALAVGLRPRTPLPPEPQGYSVERPLASRTDEVTVRVRRED